MPYFRRSGRAVYNRATARAFAAGARKGARRGRRY